MKIWLLTSEFPPDYGGGISTYCLETAKMFASFGHQVLVLVPGEVKTRRREEEQGYTVVRFNPRQFYTSSFLGHEANLSYAFSQVVKELMDEEGAPDIIESQEYIGIAYYLLLYKWLQYPVYKDLKILLTLHAPSFLYLEYNKVPVYQLPYFWVGEMERFCIRAADMLISPTQYLVDEIRKYVQVEDRKIHVLKNPYAVRGDYSATNIQQNKIVFFGKLIPQKGCLELINYFRELWNEGFGHALYMIGGGNHLYHPEGIDMIDFIRAKYSKEIQDGKLVLLGSVKPQEIDRHIRNSHVVIVPSTVDNLPYTVIEAMERRKVVLASKQGGQRELIDNGINGFIFDHREEGSFRRMIEKVLSMGSVELEVMGRAAAEKVRSECSYAIVYGRKIALLEQLCNTSRASNVFPFTRPLQPSQTEIALSEESLLSIVIPYYNMGAYVEDTIRSIKASSYKNTEIILVDDGSTEQASIDLLPSLVDKYGVKLFQKRNEGLAIARNYGAARAQGELLAFLDPDDTVEPSYYEKAITVLRQYGNVSFAGCWAKYFGGASGFWPAFNPEPPYLLFHNMINSSALVYKKEAFLKAGLNDPVMIYGMEDYESVISMVSRGYQGVALPEPLWNYRVRKNSMARGFTREKQIYLYRLITEKHEEFYAKFAAGITGLLNANGPGYHFDNPTKTYRIPGSGVLGNKITQFVLNKVKANPRLRKVAIRIKRLL